MITIEHNYIYENDLSTVKRLFETEQVKYISPFGGYYCFTPFHIKIKKTNLYYIFASIPFKICEFKCTVHNSNEAAVYYLESDQSQWVYFGNIAKNEGQFLAPEWRRKIEIRNFL